MLGGILRCWEMFQFVEVAIGIFNYSAERTVGLAGTF